MTRKFSLKVFYDHGELLFERDEEAHEIAGIPSSGGGTGVKAMVRDLQFDFITEEEMLVAKERFQQAGFRFFP